MTTIAFDTLKFARALREKAHLTTEQAEGFAEAITEALHDDLATKADLKAEVAGVKAEIEIAKRDLKIWFGSVMVIAVGVILAAIRHLPAGHQ